ncbi:MAG: hypothetical protein WC905_00425 [Patescibacteria group bacterium]|jgi:hypothetical protein
MFGEQLKKILNLIKQTGDRVVIFDGTQPTDSYVVMNFDNYAQLRTGDNWENSKELTSEAPVSTAQSLVAPADSSPIIAKESGSAVNLTEEDLTDKINREISMWKNRDDSAYLGEENKPKKAWQIPSQVKDKAKEIE